MALERVTVREAARRLGVSVATVRRRIAAGELDAETEERPQGTRFLVLLDDDAAEREKSRAQATRAQQGTAHDSTEVLFLRAEVERLHDALYREQQLHHAEKQAHNTTRAQLEEAREQLRLSASHQSTEHTEHDTSQGSERDAPQPRRRWWALWIR